MIGRMIDRYQILGELGEGGMGTVYRANDSRFGREVAIKVLPSHFLHNAELRQRFEREAKIIASLEHPAIVPVYDSGEYNGQPFLVMRLMSGGSLKNRLKNGPLPLTEIARIMSHLAPALDQAHAKGIIHRDLKPSNILFDQHNLPYIADFGIAKQTQSNSHLTSTGSVMGTPEYMSPEQARGQSNLSGHSDIYALGAILFQMLTGDVPYRADTPMGVVLRHITDPVPRIIRADLAATWQPVINRAMAKLPQERYPTTGALAADVMARVQGPQRYQPHSPLPPAPAADHPTVMASGPNTPGYSTPSPVSNTPGYATPPPVSNMPPGYATPPPVSPPSGQRNRGKIATIVGIVSVLGLFACLCMGAFAWSVIQENQATQTKIAVQTQDALAAMQATQTEEAKPTPTATATQTPRPTRTVRPTATSQPTPLPTPDRSGNAEAEAVQPIVDELVQDAELVYELAEGTLEHAENTVTTQSADLELLNFAVRAQFYNPYDPSERGWDYGFIFRDVSRTEEYYSIIVDSDKEWALIFNDPEGHHRRLTGTLENLNLSTDESNLLALLVSDTTGYFYVNQEYVATLDLSELTTSGDLRVAAGFYQEYKVAGEQTKFEEFKVWALGDTASAETASGLLFEDDFSDTSGGWDLISDEDATNEIIDGQYHITVIRENLLTRGHPSQEFSNFRLQVETTQVDGPDDNLYGVVLRLVDNDNYYFFGISGDGYYNFGKFEDDEATNLVNWTESSAIKTGQASNFIEVVCEGDSFTFFVNGERLDSYRDSTFASGDIGLFAGRFEAEGAVHISFDNVKVWAIE